MSGVQPPPGETVVDERMIANWRESMAHAGPAKLGTFNWPWALESALLEVERLRGEIRANNIPPEVGNDTAAETGDCGVDIEYRVEFQLQRRRDGEHDFTEIGFGSSGAWGDLDQAMHMASSAVVNGEWETEPGMPRPSEVMGHV